MPEIDFFPGAEAEAWLSRDGRHWRLTNSKGKGPVHAGN